MAIPKKILILNKTLRYQLFYPDIGKPVKFLEWCVINSVVDLSVLQWIKDIPEFEKSPVPDYAVYHDTEETEQDNDRYYDMSISDTDILEYEGIFTEN